MRGFLSSPLGFLIGFALGAFGGGGSILTVPALVYAAGQSPSDATTTSLLIVAGAAAFGLIGHWKAGRVRATQGIIFGLVGIGGSIAGTKLNSHLDGDLLLGAFSLLILVAAWRMLTGCPSCTRVGEELAISDASGPGQGRGPITKVLLIVAAGTAVGFVTGLFGVGGGFVIVPALTLALGFTMTDAVGTSLLVIIINAMIALMARGGIEAVEWNVAIPFTIAALLGVGSGVASAGRFQAETLLRGFVALLVAVAIYTGAQSMVAFVG